MKIKKASVGEIMSWFVATIIIFFILLFFTFATAEIAGKKFIPFFRGGGDKIKLIKSSSIKMENQRGLFKILKYPIGNSTIKEMIIKWWGGQKDLKKKVEGNLTLILGNDICYFFKADDPSIHANLNKYIWVSKGFQDALERGDGIGSLDIQSQITRVNLFINGDKIRIRFYRGKCY